MAYQREKVQTTIALWVCDGCPLWWLSETEEEPRTWRLVPLAEPDAPRWSSMPPAWKVVGPDPSVCPLKTPFAPLPFHPVRRRLAGLAQLLGRIQKPGLNLALIIMLPIE